MTMNRHWVAAALLAMFSLAAPAFSQSTGSLSGTVQDVTQAVLPGTTITVTNLDTAVARTAVTNSAGAYTIPSLPVGSYKVTAELVGFQTQTFTDIRVGAAAQVRMNFTMDVRKLEQSIEVSVQAENLLLESSSSTGVVLPEKKLVELPLVNSNVLSLIKVMGGVTLTDSPIFGADDTSFAGVSATNVNLQRDGITVNDVRYGTGLNSPVNLNPELIGEFRLVLAPVDAEMGRGNGQVQVVTRSGANAFHGSGVWNIQNTALDANEWMDNKNMVPRDWRNQNEYTISIGGPIIKNKTFFFALWDHQFSRLRNNNVNVQVPTPCARKGIFRWFDSWQNGNYLTVTSLGSFFNPAITPVVDITGNPKAPLTNPDGTPYSGTLRHAHVFGPLLKTITSNDCSEVTINAATGFPTSDWVNYSSPYDPYRTPDATGYIKRFMAYVPQVNNYLVGDGLNWGGHRWVRRLSGADNIYGLGEGPNRKQINVRIDHNFSDRHRISGAYSHETNEGEDSFPTWPQNSYGGLLVRTPKSMSVNFTSTIRPTLLNEARIGLSRTESFTYAPLDNPKTGTILKQKLSEVYPTPNNLPVIIGIGNPGYAIAGGSNIWGSGRGNMAATWGGHDPRWVYADTITWTKGRHSFKFGGEYQRTQSYQELNGLISFFGGANVFPSAVGGGYVGSGFTPNTGLHTPWYTAVLPGMVGNQYAGNHVSGMYNLMNIYAGNISSVDQWFFINSPSAKTYNDYTKNELTRILDYRQNQFNIFAKDDWKITDSLTLNLGVRYEWYGVPYLKGGMTAGLKEGALSVLGRSGRSFDKWMVPGAMNADGSVTYAGKDAELAFIGPDSPNPNMQVYNDDYNNFGPAVGFAWQLPWGAKGKTTLRGGYQMTYLPPGRADSPIMYMPGITYSASFTGDTQTPYINLSNLPSLLPVKLPDYIKTPAADPVIPVSQRRQSITVYDPNLRTPYIQNLTLSLTRNFGSNVTFDVRYIGTLTRKQNGTLNLNAANFLNNGLKAAFDDARRGGESALLDRMFRGINLAGWGYGPVGSTFAGVLQTGAMHLRASSNTNSNLANGNYASLAGTLATLNYSTTYPGNETLPPIQSDILGTVLRYNSFPENFIYTSPQFSSASIVGNLNYANYHSMQAQLTLRPVHGFSFSTTYTWSRNLGLAAGAFESYTDPFNRAADYTLLSMHRAHQVTSYGTFDLPMGQGRLLFSSASGLLDRIVGGWQLSWILTAQTGRPASISAQSMLYANGTPNLVGEFDTKAGRVYWDPGAETGNFFAGAYAHVPDPQCNNVTTAQGLWNNCTLQAIALAGDPSKLIFTNPLPGTRGTFGRNNIAIPSTWNTDMAMSKIIRVAEGKSFQLRIDATNIFNHPQATSGAWQSGVRVRVPGAPVMSLASAFDWSTFSFITRPLGYLDAKVGARTFQAKIRFDF